MGCGKKTQGLDDNQKKILHALSKMNDPASGKDIAQASGLDSKTVSNKVKTLKNKGYIDSPVRCKYAITEAGKKEIC